MELIKQLDENLKTQMDEETLSRLVRYAVQDIKDLGPDAADKEKEEVVWGLIENIPGFEEVEDAVALFNKVMPEVRKQL